MTLAYVVQNCPADPHSEPLDLHWQAGGTAGSQPVAVAFLGKKLAAPRRARGVALNFDIDAVGSDVRLPVKPEEAGDAINGRPRIVEHILIQDFHRRNSGTREISAPLGIFLDDLADPIEDEGPIIGATALLALVCAILVRLQSPRPGNRLSQNVLPAEKNEVQVWQVA